MSWALGDSSFGLLGLQSLVTPHFYCWGHQPLVTPLHCSKCQQWEGGSETLFRVQTCRLPCNFIRAFLLYVIGNLGHSCLEEWDDQVLLLDSSSLEGLEALELVGLVAVGLEGDEAFRCLPGFV